MLKHWRNRAAALGLSLCLVGALCPVARAAGPEVSAQSAVVLTADTGAVLFEKDGHTPRPVASTTKIMTALLALEAAQERGIPSVAFCCISTGEFHFPNRRAAEIALKTVRDFQKETSSQIEVIFNVYKDADLQIYRELLGTA